MARVIIGLECVAGNATRSAAEAAKLDIKSKTAADGRLVVISGGDIFLNSLPLCTRSVDSFEALCSVISRSELSNKLTWGGGNSTRTAANSRRRLLKESDRCGGVSSEMLLLLLGTKFSFMSEISKKLFELK